MDLDDLVHLGDLGEEEEYDSQRSDSQALGEEAKKSKRARPRLVKYEKKPREEADLDLVEGADVSATATVKKKRVTEKRGEEAAKEDPTPAIALAALGQKFKDQLEFFKAEGSQLHCGLCGNTFGTRASVWKKHIKSSRHLKSLEEQRKTPSIADALAIRSRQSR